MPSRREVALGLSEEILEDLEMSRIPAPDVLKKVSRLARLLDDTEKQRWIYYEMSGYDLRARV